MKFVAGLLLLFPLVCQGDVSHTPFRYWRFPGVKGNERRAIGALKQMGSIQVTFKASDSDMNDINDYWTADLSGLYRISPIEGAGWTGALRMIEWEMADADIAPVKKSKIMLPHRVKKPVPFHGYLFGVLKSYEYEPGKQREYGAQNRNRFGVFCYPADYGNGARMTFIINEGGTMFKKDTRGRPVEVFPLEPREKGWKKVD